ncbi:nucleic acid-binding protein [Streptomyces geranii]|uniref:nucleic acid-binding protein n=1 Tax=Streptomyces geranii TaxID=2058923 RepID=UPI000D03D38B|nr:nucleic acid-binding protein [Streptomyces geranii]
MATTYDFPDDLLQLQQALNTARAELSALLRGLPHSVEPMEAWQRPEGHWQGTARPYADSPGWTEQEQKEVATRRERERDLAAAIVTHSFWSSVDTGDRMAARTGLKHAHNTEDGEDQEAA